MKRFLTILLIILFSRISVSQNQNLNLNLNVEHISLEKGISNNLIFTIVQDSKGFIWFGTMFGLVRFDGINYKTFRHDPLDSNSLSNDDIISIYEDNSGKLWFGTYNGGLNKYDREEGTFTRFLNNPENPNSLSNNTVWKIIQDKDGAMWFATEGGGLCKFENNAFTNFSRDTAGKNSISGNFIRSLAEDKDGNIWAGTFATGVNKFDKKKNIFTNFRHIDGDEKTIDNNYITVIFSDTDGDLWIGTAGEGLNKMDRNSGEVIRYKFDSSGHSGRNSVLSIDNDYPGHLLIGTSNGLYKFDKSNGKFERFKIYPDKNEKQESVIAFTKDKSGVIWVSTYLDGLHKIFFTQKKFSSMLQGYSVKCICEDRSGKLWIGTQSNGLMLSQDSGKTFKTFLNEKNNSVSLSNNVINSIAEDIEGNIWIGTQNGLNKIENQSGIFKKYFADKENQSSISSNNILKIYSDKAGALWIGTDNGLNKFSSGSQDFTRYFHSGSDKNSLNNNTILSIYEDEKNELWIGTYGGLNRLDKNSGRFRHYRNIADDKLTISNNYVFSFCEDTAGNFWIGTGNGLNIFDRKAETFFQINKSDGLANGVIAGIEESNDSYLWISTFKGISRLNFKKNEFKNYDIEDGLLSNMFNQGSYFKKRNGEILFGGINGINVINPDEFNESEFIPEIVLTSIIKFRDNIKKESDISGADEIELSYRDNIIEFQFTSLDFTKPQKNNFEYMLEGFDDDWRFAGNSHNAVYTNLNSGKYVFKVRGTNSDGIWNDKATSIKVIITPPFWKTYWFYGIVLIILAAAIYLLHSYRLKRKIKNALELEKVKEQERENMREQAARDYHDELGHKLTRISMYSRRINKKLRPSANGLTDDLNSIIEASASLQSGAKDLIWTMNPQEDSLFDFGVRLRDFGNDLFENTGIVYTVSGITDEFKNIVLSMNNKRHLIYIFKEGMNNILKYSRCANVKLDFSMNHLNDDLCIVLSDDGFGFDIDNCQKGYGLKNIFSRAEKLKIDVEISSKEKSGTKIILKTKISNLIIT